MTSLLRLIRVFGRRSIDSQDSNDSRMDSEDLNIYLMETPFDTFANNAYGKLIYLILHKGPDQ